MTKTASVKYVPIRMGKTASAKYMTIRSKKTTSVKYSNLNIIFFLVKCKVNIKKYSSKNFNSHEI